MLTEQSAWPQFSMHRNHILGMSDTIDLNLTYSLHMLPALQQMAEYVTELQWRGGNFVPTDQYH